MLQTIVLAREGAYDTRESALPQNSWEVDRKVQQL